MTGGHASGEVARGQRLEPRHYVEGQPYSRPTPAGRRFREIHALGYMAEVSVRLAVLEGTTDRLEQRILGDLNPMVVQHFGMPKSS